MSVKVVDLFAGPGGLGEGFSAYKSKGKQKFRIAVSIEKEDRAHQTLQLRAFFRQYNKSEVPEAYYAFLRGELGKNPQDELYKLPELEEALDEAKNEAQKLTLGEDNQKSIYRGIRQVLGKDEFVLIGGPPCQAYSIVGRSRNYGAQEKTYSANDDHRNFLYLEYLKIVAKFQPLVFVMENVKGVLSAKIDGHFIFDSIRRDLQDPFKTTRVKPDNGRSRHKYKIYSFVNQPGSVGLSQQEHEPSDFIIKAEDYGVPQARHRVILLGIREDISDNQMYFEKLLGCSSTPSVGDVISDLPEIRSRLSKEEDTFENWRGLFRRFKKEYIPQLENDTHVERDVFEKLLQNIKSAPNSPDSYGSEKSLVKTQEISKNLFQELKGWYYDERMKNFVTNHEARRHMSTDLFRYFYCSTYAQIKNISPKSHNLPKVLWPNHRNFNTGNFADRFKVQLENAPGTTVTSHISKDGHYFIHFDPTQCRSLTVREAARIQTFPDNYYFVGNRTQQYVQVGNAVPPYLAKQLAEIVSNILNLN